MNRKQLFRWWPILLAPPALILTQLARHNPSAVERIYARGFYPVIAGALGRLTSLLPFSLAQLLLLVTVVWLIVLLVRLIRSMPKDAKGRWKRTGPALLKLVRAGCVVYFIFVLSCGLNYHRLSFAQQSGLDVHPTSTQELAEVCRVLVDSAGTLRKELPEDETGVMQSSFSSSYRMAKHASQVWPNVSVQYAFLDGFAARPKPVIGSRAMSYLDLGGIYIPFTFEPNVNADMPAYSLPSTMMHEISHFKGYMREDEANFLAYLACVESGSTEFAYSGTVLAMIHATNALYRADRELYYEVMEGLSDSVRRDLQAGSAYWAQFEGPAAELSTSVNNAYLRANSQAEGVQSYGRMVDLLIAWHQSRDADTEN